MTCRGTSMNLSVLAGENFWRALILSSRGTGEIYAKLRFRYSHQQDGNWAELRPEQEPGLGEKLRTSIEEMVTVTAAALGVDVRGHITCHYPPDDQGHGESYWLHRAPPGWSSAA